MSRNRSKSLLIGLCLVLAGLVLPSAPAGAAPSPQILRWTPDTVAAQATFEKATGAPLRAGFRIEPTVFPRYYALRNAAGQSAYFRDDMQWTANVRSAGWTTAKGRAPAPGDIVQWQREQVNALPLDLLLPVERRTRFVAVVWSAPDCPFCRKLEGFLENEGISVYVVPVGLSPEGYERSARAYCAADPAAAWRSAFRAEHDADTTARSDKRSGCSYPRDAFVDVGFFLGRGRLATPIVVFADGSTITGWDGERGPARMREMVERGAFFASP